MRRRRILNFALVAVLVVLAAAVIVLVCVRRGPAFYGREELWDAARLGEGADGFTVTCLEAWERSNHGGDFEITLTEAQVNGFLAYALHPDKIPEPRTVVPDPAWLERVAAVGERLEEPRVRFEPGKVIVAGWVSFGPVSGVASAAVRLEARDGRMTGRVSDTRLGLIPVEAEALREAIDRKLARCFRAMAGKVEVNAVEIRDGSLTVEGRLEGRRRR